ncbi:hypothetical protein ABH940_005574 [Streptacidiphilus sp. BW17]|uniref:hypothetical protein n=1 Tax=Streptacidiphilus sp. BW17 TaxID=3156274 RepID=UPI003512F50D
MLRRAGFRQYSANDEHALELHGLSGEETQRRTLRAERMLRHSGYVTHIVPDIAHHTETDPHSERQQLDSAVTALADAVHCSVTPDEVGEVLYRLADSDTGVLELAAEALETSADWLTEAHRILPGELAALPALLARLAEQYRDLNAQVAVAAAELSDRSFPHGGVTIRPRPGSRLPHSPWQPEAAGAPARAATTRSTSLPRRGGPVAVAATTSAPAGIARAHRP